jgi:HPt (histidine-containing phosphotransfer) domain-containing protein
VLEEFCRDANRRLEFLNIPHAEAYLKSFITQVHALKGISASIGAARLSEEADELEKAGRRGDMAFIRERVGAYHEDLANLVRHIAEAVGKSIEDAGEASNNSLLELNTLFTILKDALEAEDVMTADAILDELSRASLEPEIKNALSEAADLVLMSKFAAAAKSVSRLLT